MDVRKYQIYFPLIPKVAPLPPKLPHYPQNCPITPKIAPKIALKHSAESAIIVTCEIIMRGVTRRGVT